MSRASVLLVTGVAAGGMVLLSPGAAFAATQCPTSPSSNDYNANGGDCVDVTPTPSTSQTPSSTPTTEVKGVRFGDSDGGSLPFTGAEISLIVAVGAGAVGAGVLATRAGRKRPRHEA